MQTFLALYADLVMQPYGPDISISCMCHVGLGKFCDITIMTHVQGKEYLKY